jgi:cyclophilin family peptidyl-prolyl cis-trans isomerase
VQWGLKGDPKIDEMYQTGANIKDDPSNKSNKRGRITFATSGPNSRSTQVNFVERQSSASTASRSFLDRYHDRCPFRIFAGLRQSG